MKRGVLLFALTVSTVAVACPRRGAAPDLDAEAAATPLQRALVLAGADPGALGLPFAAEAGYTIPTSYPVIDAVLAAPLAAGPWADGIGARLDAAGADPTALAMVLADLSPGGSPSDALSPAIDDPPASETSDETSGDASWTRAALPSPTDALTSARGAIRTEHLPPLLLEALVDLAGRLERVNDAARGWDTRGGPPRAPPRPPEEYFIDPRTGRYRFLTHPIGVQLEFLPDGAALDHAAITHEAIQLLDAARGWAARLREIDASKREEARPRPGAAKRAAEPPSKDVGLLLHLETTLGPIIVGGRGSDRHSGDALLAIDLGGDDVWTNNAGANFGIASYAALAIDLDGNDRYQSLRPHAQGAGFVGIGILLDAGTGADGYFAGVHAQGAGFFGVGILWDEGGDDAYQAEGFAQGAGTFGTGLLVDEGGNDKAVVKGRGQGFGSTLGLGALLDFAGDDQRRLGLPGRDPSDPHAGGGQGAGWGTRPFPWTDDVALHGGVGLLYDRAGNDTYYGRNSSQGSGWFLGLGLLLERAGDDRYLGEERSQGSGSHLAAGILIDSGGADAYTGLRSVQGAADDRAFGLLWDRGDSPDGYSVGPGTGRPGLGRDGQGFARRARALGILVDDGGDDAYTAERDAMGEVIVPASPVAPPHGLLLDLGGTDTYEKVARRPGSNPADAAAWSSEDLAAGLDTTAPHPGFAMTGMPSRFGPAGWNGRVDPDDPAEIEAPSSAASEYARIEREIRTIVGAPGGTPQAPDAAQAPHTDLRVVRLAAKAKVLKGDFAGVRTLVGTLGRRTEDNSGRAWDDSLPAWLALATGVGSPDEYDSEPLTAIWRDAEDDWDPTLRSPALHALERARFAARDNDPEALLDAVQDAVATAVPGDKLVRRRAARLAATWADILADPESHRHHDPALARRLAEAAILWNPTGAGAFVDFAWASLHLGDFDACRRAIEKIDRADPDHPELEALRMEIAERAP